MELKKYSFRIVLVAVLLVLSVLAVARTVDLYGWFYWWVSDGSPIHYSGSVAEIYEYSGRESGKQRISFSDDKGEELILHSAFERKVLERLEDSRGEFDLRYYPTPTGRSYIYFLSDDGVVIYEEDFRNSGFPGFLMLMVCVFYYLIILFILKVLLRKQGG